ncbi:Aspartyl/glutamyl-tRNA(Asn/Gln) amidotransferase subunit B [Desulfovibrio sp. X2]|uniref:Asp-tRNA(Asn)/Glu-tRNA(Gln) amidotransferase subunit GatB n=1 Tax=Desulfovibrio sp. X2 TaxID=941449 RepID=UPI000358F31A|nr:Asp-tRNA(Asn)/Glu-tRNA(Gln) amidotransferase subunit GatB [Desulfovibrio sp. X2]EPR41719.1 Aspartyl/glutamyl-tRNA(Asn/Gln) amidotransferase subunit B [Desulfovibrio sp. X2]
MAEYEAVIGLEVHAQLTTNTKLFCGCSTHFGDEPNANVCPVCAAMPGVLPVMNDRALEYACKMAMAVDARINMTSIFARKNYFYPDLPKGYQISQYEQPLCEHGRIDIEAGGGTKTIGITRIHMEEDAGKNIHSSVENKSFVDLNRCGVPLIEIVSEPDLRSSEEAVAYLKELRSILVYLGICDGNMEEGSFRCDANVSVRRKGATAFGTRAEIKNVNSFRNVQRAIDYEIGRHIDCIEDGEAIVQETRLFDANKGVTQSMRGKEEAHDYRYFPDPDLVPVQLEPSWVERWRGELPELPAARRARFASQYGLPEKDAAVLTSERDVADYFEAAVGAYAEPKKIANWIMSELLRELKDCDTSLAGCKLTPKGLATLVRLVDSGAISGKIGKQIFGDLFASGEDPEAYVKAKGLSQISDSGELDAVVDAVVAEHPAEAERYRAGEKKLTGFFVGQIMKKTKGQANPKLVNELLARKLG